MRKIISLIFAIWQAVIEILCFCLEYPVILLFLFVKNGEREINSFLNYKTLVLRNDISLIIKVLLEDDKHIWQNYNFYV